MTTRARRIRRLHHPGPDRCGRNVIWVGPGSAWDNPWRRQNGDRHLAAAIKIAHEIMNSPRTVHAGSLLCGPKPPAPWELAIAHAGLYRIWIEDRVDEMQGRLKVQMRLAIEGSDSVPFPAPPSAAEIRAALRGRSLADIAPKRHASHAGVLLEIANRIDEEAAA